MTSAMAPIALTGATGFLGGHIARALLAAGLPLRAVVRDPAKAAWLADAGAEIAVADLSDTAALERALAGTSALISNASLGSWAGDLERYMAVNVDGIARLVSAAVASDVRRVVLISTVAVLKTSVLRPMSEDAPGYDAERRRFNWSDWTTDWRYARTKTLAEQLARREAEAHGLELTILRPGPIYGSGDPKLSARLLRQARRRLVAAPTVGVPMVHAGDVAAAVVAALDTDESIGRTYNLAGPPVSPAEVVRTLKQLGGWPGLVVPVPLPLRVRYDCGAAERDLGFSPRPLAEGVREMMSATRLS